jgi:hypothetical protein
VVLDAALQGRYFFRPRPGAAPGSCRTCPGLLDLALKFVPFGSGAFRGYAEEGVAGRGFGGGFDGGGDGLGTQTKFFEFDAEEGFAEPLGLCGGDDREVERVGRKAGFGGIFEACEHFVAEDLFAFVDCLGLLPESDEFGGEFLDGELLRWHVCGD